MYPALPIKSTPIIIDMGRSMSKIMFINVSNASGSPGVGGCGPVHRQLPEASHCPPIYPPAIHAALHAWLQAGVPPVPPQLMGGSPLHWHSKCPLLVIQQATKL